MGVGRGRGRGRGDGYEAGRRKLEGEGVGSVGLGEGDSVVGPTGRPVQGRGGKNAAVRGKMPVRESGEDIEGVSPG